MATTLENILAPGNDKPVTASAQTAASEQTTETAQSATPKRMSYEELYKEYSSYKPLTKEEQEKERKKQKREQIFAAIGDGISALSNLYFATKGAPNMYTGTNSTSQRTKERWEKLAAERNTNMKAYIDGLMKARQADDAYNASEREWARQLGIDKVKQERDKAAEERETAKEKRAKELHPYALRKAEGEAQAAESKARYADEYEQSRIGQNRAAAGASRARASYYGSGGSSGGRYYGEFRGEKYKTQADYEKAVLDAARDTGVKIYEEQVTEWNYDQKPSKQRVVARSIADIAAELEAKESDNSTMPGVGGGNGNNTMPGVKQ